MAVRQGAAAWRGCTLHDSCICCLYINGQRSCMHYVCPEVFSCSCCQRSAFQASHCAL